MLKGKKGGRKKGSSKVKDISRSSDLELKSEEQELPLNHDQEGAYSGEVEVLPALSSEDALDPEIVDDDELEEKEVASNSREIVRYDNLSAYLSEIARYPPLSKEEEHELAVRYVRNKDLEAAYKLITSNLWLVVKLAREYQRAARSLLDLVQEGNIGLMEAVKNFDPYRGVRFPSYAVWWIKAYIIRYVIANWRLVKIGTTQAQRKLFFNLKKERDRLEREGFTVEPKLLAERLNVKESEVIEMEQRLGSPDLSVDGPMGEDSDANLLSVLPSSEPDAEELVSRKQLQASLTQGLEQFASTLKDKELIIFRERMLGEEKATLHEVAEKVSLSKERVRQIEQRLREKLKTFLSKRLGITQDSAIR